MLDRVRTGLLCGKHDCRWNNGACPHWLQILSCQAWHQLQPLLLFQMSSWRRRQYYYYPAEIQSGGEQEGIYYKWASVKMTLKFHFLWSTLFWLEESVSAVYSDWLRGKSETKSCSWSAADVWRRHLELLHIIYTPGVHHKYLVTLPPIAACDWMAIKCQIE